MTDTNPSSAASRRSGRGFRLRRAIGIAVTAGLLSAVFAWMLAPRVAGYLGQNPYAVRLDGPSGTVACSARVTITATVRTADSGVLVAGQAVLWSLKISQSHEDGVSPARSVTGADGKTTTQLTFGAVSGKRKVQATVADYPATITVTCHAPATPTPAPPRATPSREPAPTPVPSATPNGSTPVPSATPVPSSPAAAPSETASIAVPSPSLPPPTGAAIAAAPTPAATADIGAAPVASSDSGGIPAALVLIGGLVILGATSVLLWTITRRRSGDGQPSA